MDPISEPSTNKYVFQCPQIQMDGNNWNSPLLHEVLFRHVDAVQEAQRGTAQAQGSRSSSRRCVAILIIDTAARDVTGTQQQMQAADLVLILMNDSSPKFVEDLDEY